MPPIPSMARGKIVAPGLIDIHTHAARVAEGARILPAGRAA